MTILHPNIVSLMVALAFAVLANAVGAQPDHPVLLEDVVVTAERRERHVQRVPMSITALTEDDLEASAIENTFDLQYHTPGLVFKTNTVLGQPYIRGVGSDLISVGADPAVATFVDGVYQTRPVAAIQNLFDVERVEILKGPQGTLFGRNATGGAVHVISKEPTPDLEAEADLLQ
jgi:iron complex outermembrane receptor protein